MIFIDVLDAGRGHQHLAALADERDRHFVTIAFNQLGCSFVNAQTRDVIGRFKTDAVTTATAHRPRSIVSSDTEDMTEDGRAKVT